MYNILWEFQIKLESRSEFEQHYGRNGTWSQVFARGKGYKGTHLFQDVSNPSRYVTLDQWESAEDFEAFEKQHKEEYSAIDKICEKLTDKEVRLGSWVSNGS